jgi:pSer/pThr/pTyr-binding forkhead associated (FHA) protein
MISAEGEAFAPPSLYSPPKRTRMCRFARPMDYQQPAPPKKGSHAELALRFISGKYQGGEFPLTEGVPVIVGRSSDLDMVLVEEMVSRRHARVELVRGSVIVEDLGSTNGTFVNGERVERAYLNEGDRLLIGTSILKLVSVEEQLPGSRRNLQKVAFGKDTMRSQPTTNATATRMTGSLDEIPLPDLMQLFGTSKKTGTLVLRGEKTGQIHLRDGVIVHAVIEGVSLAPAKAAYRMLTWSAGMFSLEPAETAAPQGLSMSAQAYLMEGFRQLDELAAMKQRLPELTSRLVLKSPLTAPLSTLEQPELEVLQACLNSPDLQAAIDRSARTDLEVTRDVLELMKRGYLEVSGG